MTKEECRGQSAIREAQRAALWEQVCKKFHIHSLDDLPETALRALIAMDYVYKIMSPWL